MYKIVASLNLVTILLRSVSWNSMSRITLLRKVPTLVYARMSSAPEISDRHSVRRNLTQILKCYIITRAASQSNMVSLDTRLTVDSLP